MSPTANGPNSSVDPTVTPPASGAPSADNPYAGTPAESVWRQGFDDGFAQPDEGHPAPSPYSPDAQSIYLEGVLAGKDAARLQPNSSQSSLTTETPGIAETADAAQGELSTGVIVGVVAVGVLAAGAVIILSGGSLAGPVLAVVLAISAPAEAGLGATAVVGTLEVGAEIGLVVEGAAAPAAISAAATGTTGAAATVAIQTPVAAAAVTTSSSTLAAVVKIAAVSSGAAVVSTTLSSDSPSKDEDDDKNCKPSACGEPLPIAWPEELPEPPELSLVRTPADLREAEALGDRGPAQQNLQKQIKEARDRHLPPPKPCDPDVESDDSRWNSVFDAHHVWPLYLGGPGDSDKSNFSNLCALDQKLHQVGHIRLDNQAEYAQEYEQCGICSTSLRKHPELQEYYVAKIK
jgi:hypothetical protein